jgi:hypothetical protein
MERQRAQGRLARDLANSQLDEQHRREHYGTGQALFGRMNFTARHRLNGNLSGYHFFATLAELAQYCLPGASPAEIDWMIQSRFAPVGAYNASTREIEINGGTPTELHRRYAHELTHAVDGPEGELSKCPAWREAWRNELKIDQDDTATEGFSRFGQMLYNQEVDRQEMERCYPRCVQFWQGADLW